MDNENRTPPRSKRSIDHSVFGIENLAPKENAFKPVRILKGKFFNKRGVSQWLNWVLLVLFAVLLSTIMYNWISGYVEGQRQHLIRITDSDDCDAVAIKAKACQNTQTLYINTTNIRELPIHNIIFRIFDSYYEVETKDLNLTIKPEETQTVKVLKLGMTQQLELIPVVYTEHNAVVCRKSMITLTDITVC
ncbi:MAG: hypothetical protein ABIH34_02745 [Nanoarchaeota archaeon]